MSMLAMHEVLYIRAPLATGPTVEKRSGVRAGECVVKREEGQAMVPRSSGRVQQTGLSDAGCLGLRS